MYTRRRTALVGVIAFTVFVASCVGASKSSDPLAPTVAGPLPGVNMNAPLPMTPVSTSVAVDAQPVTLTVSNGVTNSQRTVTYLFEVATDSAFANKVFSQGGITPGTSGQTSLKLPDPLATGHTYYWRAEEGDGANSSGYSTVVSFNVYTPIVINAPTLVSPVGNVVTDSVTPTFVVTDAVKSGPYGAITYVIEVADSQTFSNRLAVWTLGETPGQTSLLAPVGLPANTQLFWRAHAADPTTTGPLSSVAVFKTPVVVVTPPPTTGGGGTGGGTGGGNFRSLDQINLSAATINAGATDVANWAVTTNIQSITFDANNGLLFQFPASATWPNQIPPGFTGPLQYTVWACAPVNGWTCAGFIQMWQGRGFTGAPLPDSWQDWWGNQSGGAIQYPFGSYVGQAGETMAFFVTAGNERGSSVDTTVFERSNVVLVTLPAGDSGFFSF